MSGSEIVLASSNAGKLEEFAALLGDLGITLRVATAAELGALPAEGAEYEANAIAKARAVAAASGRRALADDSGLEVDGLAGAPGPLSARYGGPGLDDAGRVAHLLACLGSGDRRARFVCVAALAWPDGRVEVASGVCAGTILDAPRGQGGFGYDPVFQPEGFGESLAELPAATKNALSHRAKALAALRPHLMRG